jgi:hypothetical protein
MGTIARYALSVGAAAALLAGCGGSQRPIGTPDAMPQPAPLQSQSGHRDGSGSWMLRKERVGSPDYEVSGPLLYVTNYTSNTVTVYPAKRKNPAPIATLLDGVKAPVGDCLDSQGTLYVTNQPISNNGWVAEYPLG